VSPVKDRILACKYRKAIERATPVLPFCTDPALPIR
jgi:hypothetical protein